MAVDNLYVTYDDEGKPHFHINDEEVDEQVWKLRHPMMKEGKTNGRNQDSGRLGRVDQGGVTAGDADAKEQQRQRLRDHRDRLKAQAQATGGEGVTRT